MMIQSLLYFLVVMAQNPWIQAHRGALHQAHAFHASLFAIHFHCHPWGGLAQDTLVVEIMVGVRDWKTYDWDILGHMGVSIAMEVPKNGWFIMEHPKQKWMIWGCPYFRKPLYWDYSTGVVLIWTGDGIAYLCGLWIFLEWKPRKPSSCIMM